MFIPIDEISGIFHTLLSNGIFIVYYFVDIINDNSKTNTFICIHTNFICDVIILNVKLERLRISYFFIAIWLWTKGSYFRVLWKCSMPTSYFLLFTYGFWCFLTKTEIGYVYFWWRYGNFITVNNSWRKLFFAILLILCLVHTIKCLKEQEIFICAYLSTLFLHFNIINIKANVNNLWLAA